MAKIVTYIFMSVAAAQTLGVGEVGPSPEKLEFLDE